MVLSSRGHSKHGDICGVSFLIYPEMTQLFWGRKFPAKHHELCTTHPFTWHFLAMCWPKPPVRGCQEGPLKQLLCLEAGAKEALLRQPLRVRKGRGRAGRRQDSLQTPGWPPRTAAFPQKKCVTSPDWRVGDILSPTSFGWLHFPLTGIKIKSQDGVLPNSLGGGQTGAAARPRPSLVCLCL